MVAAPFHFRIEDRIASRPKESAQDDKPKKPVIFPPKVLEKPPFVPKKADKSLVVPNQNIRLHTEVRSKQRHEFDTLVEQKHKLEHERRTTAERAAEVKSAR